MHQESASPALSVRNLRKAFGGTVAVADFTLEVAQSEIVSLLGPSGCGKTTALRCVSGLERLTAGEIDIAGQVVASSSTHVPTHQRRVGLVFQSYALWPHMTVAANVGYGLEVLRVSGAEARRRVDDALALVDLADLGHRLPSQLSGGQQQRVALARSLIVRPRLLLLDEPLSNLDAALRDRVRTDLRALLKRIGIASIFVTHDQREALSISDRVALMAHGHIVQVGRPEELYENPDSVFAAEFLGGANLLPVEDLRESGGLASGHVPGVGAIVGRVARTPLGGRYLARVHRAQARLAHPGAPGDGNRWRGRVRQRIYEGAVVEYTVDLGGCDVKVVSGDARFREDEDVDVLVDAANVVFVSAEQVTPTTDTSRSRT